MKSKEKLKTENHALTKRLDMITHKIEHLVNVQNYEDNETFVLTFNELLSFIRSNYELQ